MSNSKPELSIRIAGNTLIPSLLALRAKGYVLTKWYIRENHGGLSGQYDAEKDGRCFSATTAEELLGLVAMWEMRGDDWRWRAGEPDLLQELNAQAVKPSIDEEESGEAI